MTELQPPEPQINGGTGPLVVAASTENVGAKRQRRPSVRLGDIGDPHYDSHLNRRNKQWKLPVKDSGKSSKPRASMNFSGSGNYHETLDGEDKSWKARDSKSRRGSSTKRVRSSWISKVEGEGDEKFSGDEDVDDGFRDFDFDSDSPLKEQSPLNSMDNVDFGGDRGHYQRRGGIRVRVSEGRDHHDGVELDGPSDTDARNWNNSDRNGVREWLNQLGLGRYAPVFEIHEVDDEVLPLLTLEDLKDMGINAVGSRRKMYSSIQKLGKGFS
ncbi:hypothetical protein LguiA_009743 [Lonicera macranthoides]